MSEEVFALVFMAGLLVAVMFAFLSMGWAIVLFGAISLMAFIGLCAKAGGRFR